jgi:hypothetical protein
MIALTTKLPSRTPPRFRFADGLHEATAGDFRRFGEKAVINCAVLPIDRQRQFCDQRIEDLQGKIGDRKFKGQRFDAYEQSLEQEINWLHQLSGIAVLKPKKTSSRTPKYDSLVKDTQLADVAKLGKTKQGVFYLVYHLDSGWKTCSFVSTSKILKALGFALEELNITNAKIKEVSPVDNGVNLRYDFGGSDFFTFSQLSHYLVSWNNSRLPVSAKPSLKEQLEAEIAKRGFSCTAINDDGLWCLRVNSGSTYLGGIAIDNQQLFVSRAGQKGEVRARFAAGAIALLANSLQPTSNRDAIAQQTHSNQLLTAMRSPNKLAISINNATKKH